MIVENGIVLEIEDKENDFRVFVHNRSGQNAAQVFEEFLQFMRDNPNEWDEVDPANLEWTAHTLYGSKP